MENPEEILHFLEEFTKLNSKDIPRELEEYLCFVAKTGDPVYQWSAIKTLFRQKLVNVITEFYEACPSVEIPPCPNVDLFNYDRMKNFILEKLDTFAAAPFTVQRICELLTTPRKEYNRIDKYMRALEKNILVVSTREPGSRRTTENGEGIVNGLESEHPPQDVSNSDINVEVDMEEAPAWPKTDSSVVYHNAQTDMIVDPQSSSTTTTMMEQVQQPFVQDIKNDIGGCTSSLDGVITCQKPEEPYVSIEPVIVLPSQMNNAGPIRESEIIVTITPDPIVKVKPIDVEPVDIPTPTITTNSDLIDVTAVSKELTTSTVDVTSPSVITEPADQDTNVLDSTTTTTTTITTTTTTTITATPPVEDAESASYAPENAEISSSTALVTVALANEPIESSEVVTVDVPTSSETVVAKVWETETAEPEISSSDEISTEPVAADDLKPVVVDATIDEKTITTDESKVQAEDVSSVSLEQTEEALAKMEEPSAAAAAELSIVDSVGDVGLIVEEVSQSVAASTPMDVDELLPDATTLVASGSE